MKLTRNELLILLVEECAEVIQAATKCLRFGYDRFEPGYGVNSNILAGEAGDLLACIDALSLDQGTVAFYRDRKIAKAEAAKRQKSRKGPAG